MVSYFTSDIRLSDRCSVAFIANGDAVYALTESPYMVRIDLDNLDRIEKVGAESFFFNFSTCLIQPKEWRS